MPIKYLQLFLVSGIVLWCYIDPIESECKCNVRFVGEYCGTVLNEKSSENNCTADMFFCGKGNLKKDAVLLKSCDRAGFSCDSKLNGGNVPERIFFFKFIF